MRRLFLAAVALVAGAGHALAGSRVWQPDVTSARLARRYLAFSQDEAVSGKMKWPNRQIRFCFDDKPSDLEQTLGPLIEAAHATWVREGLGSEFTIAKAGDDECKGAQRFDTLLVQLNTDDPPKMATYVALPGPDSFVRKALSPDVRPKMILTMATKTGMLDQVANFAHELGHAWGLYHEHQNPAYWSSGTIANALGGSVFGPEVNNWRCNNLLDYEKRTAINAPPLTVQNPGRFPWQKPDERGPDVKKMCSDQKYAEDIDFSASAYLPYPREQGIASSVGRSANDVDWDSIMLYPSGAGGVGTASPGNDQRAPILLKPDGSLIPVKTAPSQRDIAGLYKIYGRSKGTRVMETLQKVGGSATANFKKLYSKSAGHASDCL